MVVVVVLASIVIAVTIFVPATVSVPLVIVIESTAVTFPVTFIILLSVVARFHPSSALIRWSRPVTIVPAIASALRVPITPDPCVILAWASRYNSNYTRAWRWANSDSKGDLSAR